MEHKESYTVVSNPVPAAFGGLNVLFAGESQTKPNHRLGPKVYDFYLLHHVLAGKGVFACHGTDYGIGPGQSFLIEPQQLVRYASDEEEPWRYRWIAFSGDGAKELAAAAGLSAAQPVADTGRSRRVGLLFLAVLRSFRSGDRFAHLEAAGLLQLIFAEYGKALQESLPGPVNPEEEGSALVEQVVRYLSTQYAEPVSMERMAGTLGFSRAYLSRVFKRHTGMTPVHFLLKLRIDKARQLLRQRGELTVEQIAASAGFQDPLYFSKQFRRICGVSPTAYREGMRRRV